MPIRLFKHSCNWLMRLAVVLAVLISLIILVMRYVVLPNIEQYHDNITAALSKAIGNPVTIGTIEGDWQGVQPHIKLSDVRVLDAQKQIALALPGISVRVSWLTLLTTELRLARLEIERPELLIRRDTQGKIYVGGVEISLQGGDGKVANWLLHQPHMVASNALLVWVDEQRDAMPLVLNQVDLRIENFASQHRFAIHAVPPEDLSTPLDIRGEFRGSDVNNIHQWQGQVFTQLDYTDVSLWKSWLNLPREFSRGRGALRGWWGIQGGKLAHITADMELHDVAMQLGDDVPEMAVNEMRGRASWQSLDGSLEISTQNLAMRLDSGVELQPTDFFFRTTQDADKTKPASNELRANMLQFESLVGLANFLPLDTSLRSRLNAYGPRGKVTQLDARWQGVADQPHSFSIKGKFEDLALRQVGELPGFSGLTVDVDGSNESGAMLVKTQQLVVDAPNFMREPIVVDTLTGQVKWHRKDNELTVNFSEVELANQDLAGQLIADYQTQTGTLGVLDLDAKVTRGDVRAAARYIPLLALNKANGDWLNGALLAGHTEDLGIRIKANLSDFPLRDKPDAIFKIGGHFQDGVMEFDKAWPRINNITGELLIDTNKLTVKSSSAKMLAAQLQNVNVIIPDLLSEKLALNINGEATAENSVFLQFIQQSPVRGYIDGFTDHTLASGDGHLDLALNLPLLGNAPVKVKGTLDMLHSDIDLGASIPFLRNTQGALTFSESGMQAKNVSAEIFGGAANINVEVDHDGVVKATAQGHNDLDTLHATYPQPVLNYLHGNLAWRADISVVNKLPHVVISSDLQGVSSTLPLPLTKQASDVLPLRVELASLSGVVKEPIPKRVRKTKMPVKATTVDEQDVLTAKLGNVLQVKILRRQENGAMVIKHGMVNFGETDKPLTDETVRAKAGIWLTGNVPVLSLQGWEKLTSSSEKPDTSLPIAGANLHVEKLTGFGLTLNDLQVDALKRGDGLSAQLASAAVNGDITWQPHGGVEEVTQGYVAQGKLTAHLRNLTWQDDAPVTANAAQPVAATEAMHFDMPRPGNLPALEVDIANLQVTGKKIGSFTMVGHPEGKDWRLRRLSVSNPDGSLLGDGLWHEVEQGNMQSQINLTLDISDAGKILARSGYPDTVKDGSGKLVANLSWQGAPDKFNFATLNGSLNLDTGKGRFVKMDPGIGKLLSVLSLQALPKHITLDFQDVFSQGFQFDNINGNAAITNGVMDTQNFHIDGSSAKVTMKGNVNLNNETQNLRVKILPTVGNSVSLVTAIVVNPVVGVGAFLANKVLGDPLDKLASFEYNISGTWRDPDVVKVGGGKVKLNPIK